MREILFRGKRTSDGEWDGEWIEGTLFRLASNLHPFIMLTDRYGESYEVDPETVGQFTGKTVKNGKVFDGDILKSIDGIFFVRWDEEKSAFVMRFLEYPFETLYLEEMWDDAEIIGNIHDNPELLENP